MRAGIAAGTASSDPLAALVAGGAAATGRGTGVESTSFGTALELAERMLDAPTGAEGSVRAAPPATTELATAPSPGESAGDATEAAPGETSVSAVPVDTVTMIGALAVASAPMTSPSPTAAPADASIVSTSDPEDGSSSGIGESASASLSAAAAVDGTGSVLVARSESATGGADADAPLVPAAAPARSSAHPDPAGSGSSIAPGSDAAAVNDSPSTPLAPAGLTPVPGATQGESVPPVAAPPAPPTAGGSSVTAASASSDGAVADRSDHPAVPPPGSPSAPAVAPAASAPAPGAPILSQPDPPASARSVATQVSPVVVTVAQRPTGSHQITMTVSPDTLGPVTVRAHIGQNGDVRVELVGATDAGREALRAIVSDLRRDLAAVLPHANLSLTSSSASSTDAGGSDRFAQPGADTGSGGQAGDRRGSGPAIAQSLRVDASDRRSLPTPALAVAGGGLDTFA